MKSQSNDSHWQSTNYTVHVCVCVSVWYWINAFKAKNHAETSNLHNNTRTFCVFHEADLQYTWILNAVWILLNDVGEERLKKGNLNTERTCLVMNTLKHPLESLIYLLWNVEALRWPGPPLEEDVRLLGSSCDLADLEDECTVKFLCVCVSVTLNFKTSSLSWCGQMSQFCGSSTQLCRNQNTECKQLSNLDYLRKATQIKLGVFFFWFITLRLWEKKKYWN